MSSLPPGVSDYDIDRHTNGPMCTCGHWSCDHNEDDTCDCYINFFKKIECPCTKFTEGEPEPEYDHDD